MPRRGRAPEEQASLLNLEAAAAASLPWRRLQGDLEHAVLEVRLRAVGDCPLRQRNRAVEASVADLASVPALALFVLFLFPLALDHERVFFDLDVDVVFVHPRQV